jgi:hypothetical protein
MFVHKEPERERAVPEATPKIGVTKVGEVCKTFSPVPVFPTTYKAPPEVEKTEPVPREDMVVEPLAATKKSEVPELEATLKGFKFPEPCTLKDTVEEVAFTPATVPLAIKGAIEVKKVLEAL